MLNKRLEEVYEMPEYVIRIEGKFNSHLTREYEDLATNLHSFSITVKKETVAAIPYTHLQMKDGQAACELLQQEISPLLTVFGSKEGQAIELEITNVVYPSSKTSSVLISSVTASIGEPILTAQELRRKLYWASVDPIYRDLLDFYTEAQAAPNPRPVGYKIVERLEKKFGKRDKACRALSIHDLKPIVANQSQYHGDRHAKYNVGDAPARISPNERGEVLVLLKLIIDEYEKRICATLP